MVSVESAYFTSLIASILPVLVRINFLKYKKTSRYFKNSLNLIIQLEKEREMR